MPLPLIISLILSLFIYPISTQICEAEESASFMASPVTELKKTIIFLGRLRPDGKPQLSATASLVNVQGTFHLLTAKHVVVNPATGQMQDSDLLAFFNLRGGGVSVRPIAEVKKTHNIDWIFHPDPKVDVAIIPFLVDTAEDDVLILSENLFLLPQNLFELYDVFFLSYQPGIEPKGKITPIVRNGIISLLNEDGTFYIDAFAFPGNTGSPVFLKPSFIRFGGKGITIGKDPLGGRFVGIIGESLSAQELAVSAQTGRPRVVFEENTGLSKVWSVNFIQEIINSKPFQDQLKKISAK